MTTLTCNNRNTLIPTIHSFFHNTDVSILGHSLEWFILLQGCSEDHVTKVRQEIAQYESSTCQINLLVYEHNMGLSKGQNTLADTVKEYRYVLMIEDDWLCLSPSITNVSKEWLRICLDFMDHHAECSTLFLRKYVDDNDKHKSAWTRSCWYTCHRHKDNFNYAAKMKAHPVILNEDGVKFQQIPYFLFTNNPHIRRSEDYYRVGVFPMNEHPDIRPNTKSEWTMTQYSDVPRWGWAEAFAMEKSRDLTTFNVASGLFGHYEDWIPRLSDGCKGS